jgi:transcriptional regulator with XRE-family HTH domain
MNERLKEIRVEQQLTQKQMSEKIGVTEATVSRMESGKSTITEQTIKTLCREFNVNKDWLLSGEGEMYAVSKEDERLAKILAELHTTDNEKLKNLVEKMLELDDKYIEIILNLVNTVLADQKIKR